MRKSRVPVAVTISQLFLRMPSNETGTCSSVCEHAEIFEIISQKQAIRPSVYAHLIIVVRVLGEPGLDIYGEHEQHKGIAVELLDCMRVSACRRRNSRVVPVAMTYYMAASHS